MEKKKTYPRPLSQIKENLNKKGIKGIIATVKEFMDKLKYDEAVPYAYQLTYSLLLSVFPFLIFLFTLIGFLNLNANTVLSAMQRVLPAQTYTLVSDLIKSLVTDQSAGLLSFSILLAIWSASGGFRSFIKALNKIYGVAEDRSPIVVILQSILFVVILAGSVVLSLILIVFGNQIFSFLSSLAPSIDFSILKSIFKYTAPLVLILFLFTIFYMFVPSKNVKFKYALPGAIFATIAFMVATFGFQIYVNQFANYSRFYGALGTVVVLMFWMLILSLVMVIGGELNSIFIIKKGELHPFLKKDKNNYKFKELRKSIKEITKETEEEKEQREKRESLQREEEARLKAKEDLDDILNQNKEKDDFVKFR